VDNIRYSTPKSWSPGPAASGSVSVVPAPPSRAGDELRVQADDRAADAPAMTTTAYPRAPPRRRERVVVRGGCGRRVTGLSRAMSFPSPRSPTRVEDKDR
jgi:hypothetical protein